MSKKPVVLMILDGYGLNKTHEGNAVYEAKKPVMDRLMKECPFVEGQASGLAVGLPDGQMGNSEVGHLNIGAGRVVYQDLVKINRACADGSILKNPEIISAYEYAKRTGKNLHIMGLTSNGGVHSELKHLLKLIDIAKEYGIDNTYVHCFMDGRDTDPRSGKGFVEEVINHCNNTIGAVATVIGRFYAMDRDKRWNRVKVAYDQLVHGKGKEVDNLVEAMQDCYDSDTPEHKNTDEFMEPLVNANVDGRIKEGDVVIFFNYRNDRAREITYVLTQKDMPEEGMTTIPGLQFYCMTPYDADFKNVHILFPKENVNNTLGEYLSSKGLKQLHTAETEKYAHVTFFLNGGIEEPKEGEERVLVASPKVATYDLQPEMSAPEVTEKLVAAINEDRADFYIVNFANCDMVGHTGVFDAAVKAVEAVDACVETVWEAVRDMGGCMFLTADHGNADKMENPDGTPFTAHTTNPVPFLVAGCGNVELRAGGCLADIAPTMLPYIGLPVPKEMTGKSIIED